MLYFENDRWYATSNTIDGVYYVEDFDHLGTAYITIGKQTYILV
jgi:hypothetical protein